MGPVQLIIMAMVLFGLGQHNDSVSTSAVSERLTAYLMILATLFALMSVWEANRR